MGVPEQLLPHTVTLVRPGTSTDAYGNAVQDYDATATRASIQAWMQQDQRREARTDGREAGVQAWLMVTNHEDVRRGDRVEHAALTFEVEGPPEPVSMPAGFHHTEATLRVVDG